MEINYQAGPTAARFHASAKVVRGFRGPVGNGKSVSCIMEMLRLASEQWPNDKGVRKTRWAIVRNTGPELRTTTLNTWKQWIPEEISPVVMHPIITTKLIQPIKSDGTSIEMEVYFLALDNARDVKKLLSLEVSGIFINEAREIPYAIVAGARERIGRYPSHIDGYPEEIYGDDNPPCRRKALIMDTNPPDTDHWWYQLAEEGCLRKVENKAQSRKETAKIFDFFAGPAPLIKVAPGKYEPNPDAENIKHLPGGYQYYLDMIAGNREDYINVQVMGNYGVIMDGKPVFPEYNDRIHCPEENFMPIPGIPICLGWDGGLTPSCIIGQMTETGQARIIAELVADDMSVAQFARDVVKPFLQKHFSDYTIGFSLFDPSGNNRGEGEGKAAIKILNDEYETDNPLDMGFITEAAPTNDPTRRIHAVASFLTKLVGPGEPGMVVAKRCKTIRKGFQGAYKYKRVSVGGSEDRFRDTPDKNMFSHAMDALEYLCLGFVGGYVRDLVTEQLEEMLEYDDMESSGNGYW